jgi:DNA-binding transcriptional MerR regulator
MGREIGVTGRTILYWEDSGIIKAAIRVGRIVRFDREEVKARLKELTDASRQDDSSGGTNQIN